MSSEKEKVNAFLKAIVREHQSSNNSKEFLEKVHELLGTVRLHEYAIFAELPSANDVKLYVMDELEEGDTDEEKDCQCNNCCVCDEARGRESEAYDQFLRTRGQSDVGKPECTHVFTRGIYMGHKCQRPAVPGTSLCEVCFGKQKIARVPQSQPFNVVNPTFQAQQVPQTLQFQVPIPQFGQAQQFNQLHQLPEFGQAQQFNQLPQFGRQPQPQWYAPQPFMGVSFAAIQQASLPNQP